MAKITSTSILGRKTVSASHVRQKGKRLSREFFERAAPIVARDLIGKFLVRKLGGKTVAHMITEVEAYDGFKDKASHASRGQTPRNAPMFGSAGAMYVYFTYGMHWMLNIVCGKIGYPSAVLIRGVEGINGPARLTKALSIDRTQNTLKLGTTSGVWIEDRDVHIPRTHIQKTPRIGVAYAGEEWSAKLWRFVLK
ncbi:MAG TPA: DNA-3-methyladenine glycosylase [Candidatus Paceibacterota bacterium]